MTVGELTSLVKDIVAEAHKLSLAHTSEVDAPVNYACVFSRNPTEYEELVRAARELGSVAEETKMGPVFLISPIDTDAGRLQLLKIRRYDPNRLERGDADFTLSHYDKFKKEHIGVSGFRLIRRERMEMLELSDPSFNVLAYYSYPTLSEVLGV
ncbi:hypothetical protein KGQ31_03015 [Patescibacteria group bacterium]|nr:hypothetical protein [Patescibacteria group bacterium]